MNKFGALALLLATTVAATAQAQQVAPNQVVDSLEGTFGKHPGLRKNHTKGTCAVGEFVGTSDAAKLSRSPLFSGKAVPVVARFSLAGGNPEAADATRNARGLAIEFRLPDGSRQHFTMLNTPVFGAANPNTFNDMIIAARPDPATGRADPAKLKAFFASHPDAMGQAAFLQGHNPPAEYYTSAFYGIHTFKFVDAKKTEHLVKWRFVPHDFLEHDLIARLAQGPVQWDMIVTVGKPGDPQDNPTLPWPDDRDHIKAGLLTISKATPQAGADCEKINFDPLVMADGIAPTNDPVLLFRSPAYAISFGKRLSGN